MRNQETWNSLVKQKALQIFSPRIQQDIETLPPSLELLYPLKSMYIYGKVGCGKTIYAAQLILNLIKQDYLQGINRSVLFTTEPDMFMQIKKGFANEANEIIIDTYSQVDTLVIDDIGSKNPTDWVLEILYLIINARYEHLKTTIFTSNFDLKELANRYGDDRICSRIERMGDCIFLKRDSNS